MRYSRINKKSIHLKTKNMLQKLLFKLLTFKKTIKNKTSCFCEKEREFSKEFGSLERSISNSSYIEERVELTYSEPKLKPIFTICDDDDEEYLGFSDEDEYL